MYAFITSVIVSSMFLCQGFISMAAEEAVGGKDKEYIDTITSMLIDDGEIDSKTIVSADVFSYNNSNTTLFSEGDDMNNSGEGIVVVTKNGNEYQSNYIIPFAVEDDELYNITRATGTSTDKPFETATSSKIYLKITVKYIYYSAAATQYQGPFFRPTAMTVMWKDGTASCNVSSLNAVFASRAQVWNMDTLQSTSRYQLCRSTLSKTNPTKGTTYWGSSISMSTSEALALAFNGIDTYSYVNVDFSVSYNGASYTNGSTSCNVFLDSGLASF